MWTILRDITASLCQQYHHFLVQILNENSIGMTIQKKLMTPIEEHFSLLDTSEEDEIEIEIYNDNHDSVDGISKPLDALEYEIQIHEIEKLIPE